MAVVTQGKRDALSRPREAAKSVKVVVRATQRPRWRRRLEGCDGEVEAASRVETRMSLRHDDLLLLLLTLSLP